MAVTINAKGTTENSFFLGKQGPIIKNSSGVIELRNAGDTAFAEFKAASPTTSDGLATKQYVDGVASGLEFKDSVVVATTAALDAGTYSNVATSPSGLGATFTETGTAGPLTVDGVELAVNDRILVKDQAAQLQNGIYTLTTLGVISTTSWVLTRATDADNDPSTDVSGGIYTFVESGTANSDTSWVLSLPTGDASIGVDSLAFAQFSSTGTTTVSGTGSRITVTPSGSDYAVDIASTYVGQNTITTLGTVVTGTWQGATVAVASGGTGQTSKDSVVDAGSARIIITGGANSYLGNGTDLTLDVNEGNLNIGNMTGALNLTTQVSNSLSVSNGGTGLSTITSNGIIYGNGTTAIVATAAGTEGQIFRAGTGGTPAFTSSLIIDSSGNVGIGDSTPTAILDVTQSSATVTAINAVADSSSYTGDVLTTETNTVAGSGFNHIKSTSDVDGTPDPVFRVQGDGLVFADGAYSGAGADYADYFEWEDGNPNNEDRVGQSVVLAASGKIKLAVYGENPMGVISGRPSVAGNAASDSWADKFIKDDYHRYVLNEDGNKIINPKYDHSAPYTPRPDRSEWDAVGLVGRLPVNNGQVVSASWIKIRNISDTVEEWLIASGGTSNNVTTNGLATISLSDSTYEGLTEETATLLRFKEITELYYSKLSGGFIWDGEAFDIDERAQNNISTEFMFQGQSLDDFPKNFVWRGYSNQSVKMDYHQFMNFAKASREHVKKMRAAKTKIEASVKRKRLVKSVMQCDITVGWPKTSVEHLTRKKKA